LQVIEGKGIASDLGHSRTEFVDTSKMLFIFSGAFDGLEDMIKARIKGRNTIGFVNNTVIEDESEYLKYATLEDVKQYGFNGELLGRIGALHYIPPLSKEDFSKLLKAPKGSYIEKYSQLFKISNVKLNIDETYWEYYEGWYYYKGIVTPGETTPHVFSHVEIVGDKVDNSYIGKTLSLTVSAHAVQSEHNPILDGKTYTASGWPME
jgi:hypothetical protein